MALGIKAVVSHGKFFPFVYFLSPKSGFGLIFCIGVVTIFVLFTNNMLHDLFRDRDKLFLESHVYMIFHYSVHSVSP